MKICQYWQKNNNFQLKLFSFIIIIILFFIFTNIKIVYAQSNFFDINYDVTDWEDTDIADLRAGGFEIITKDPNNIKAVKKGTMTKTMEQIKDWAIKEALVQLKKSGDVAYKQALRFFLNSLAYDTATYLATGDKGQLPMFETEGWGGYLKNTADNTAGTFIEELGKNMSTLKFNLCTPNLKVLLKINLGLQKTYRPTKPACTFSELTKNWEEALRDKDFLPKFQDMFNPWSNDLGIALTLQTGVETEVSKKVNEAIQERTEGMGIKPVRDPVSGKIKTPVTVVREFFYKPVEDSTSAEKVYTGSIVADSIDVFFNTLIGKLMDKWLKKGLVTDFPNTGRWNSLTDPNAQRQDEGITGAENRFRSLTEPNFKVRGDYDILAELTMCPDPNKAGPTNCVIDGKFREAIEKRLTVGQAMEQGYLGANGVFGFTSDGLEPRFNEGYPYRSMLILRKFRIIPVGWEVAGQKIKDKQSEVGGTKNLKNLVDCFDGADEYGSKGTMPAWCSGLIDPNWVLKAPQNNCAREGAGPEILSEQITGEGAASSLSILRNDTYCGDEKSLIKENSDGSNPRYGYCVEERRTWDFNGKSCDSPRDNTCQTFSSADGQVVSYLQNTLDYGSCNAGNAGCAKYATAGNYINGTVDWGITDNKPIYLNKNAETCEAADQGCHGFIRQSGQTVYEKLLPDYLVNKVNGARAAYDEGQCYDNQGRLKDTAPAVCSNFARLCAPAEANCEMYTDVADGTKIPAIAKPEDACPAECAGYNIFVQKQTNFDSSRSAYFIPKTAKTCSAEASGCDEFTNLEKFATSTPSVAEQKEYYSYLRQCVKPSEAPASGEGSCGEFYSWEGSDESGFQLKVASLESKSVNNKILPVTTDYDQSLCTEEIYNSPVGDPRHNDDCRQYYNRAGDIFYLFYSATKDCAEDCHPYRRTAEDDDAANCENHGGEWNKQYSACIYMAVPSQSATCSAAQSGCREYNGNTGNNVRNIFTDDFDGGIAGWADASGTICKNGAGKTILCVQPSNDSVALGQDNMGHSILVSANGSAGRAVKRTVGSAVSQGKSYVISFLAKMPANLNISLATTTSGAKAEFTTVPSKGANWQIYKTSLANLDHKVTADEFLLITSSADFYIDNIVLTEITDRYYLIKNSWRDNCDYLNADASKPENYKGDTLYMGCNQYTDRANKTSYLTKFDKLCSESSVGCEKMTDTHNSSAAGASYYKDGQKIDSASGADLTVPADSEVYAVYDQDKQCNSEAKGCALLGQAHNYENTTLYGDVYLKNNPDKYNTTLCGADAVGCQAFAYDKGEKYFKDPGDMVCEWRRKTGAGAHDDWFKKKVKRCDAQAGDKNSDGKIDGKADKTGPENYDSQLCLNNQSCDMLGSEANCASDVSCGLNSKGKYNKCVNNKCYNYCETNTDCNANNSQHNSCVNNVCYNSCITDDNDYKCTTDETKTLGLGGVGGKVSQPGEENGFKWAGVCSADNSGCGEYIDPVSKFNTNLIFNGSFADLDNKASAIPDGWEAGIKQTVTLEPNTVYRLARLKYNGSWPSVLTLKCPVADSLYEINKDNILAKANTAGDSISLTDDLNNNSRIFLHKGAGQANCTVTAGTVSGAAELKPVVIDYQLAQNLDSSSCNGKVDFDKGCVLFNERSQLGAGLKSLTWDADTTAPGASPESGGNAEVDSNLILKVTPDRVCDKWLAPRSYIKEEKDNPVVFDIGLCDAMDDNGDCSSFLNSPKTNQAVGAFPLLGADDIGNLSGYATAGLNGGSITSDYYPFGAMSQFGEVANLANGGFEFYGSNLYPVGWSWGGQNKSWNANVFSVVNNPISAQAEGIGYAREGRAFLKLGSSYDAQSEEIDVIPNKDYIITAFVNTKNLKSGVATIDIVGVEASNKKNIEQNIGNDWQFKVGSFKTGDSSRINIKLYAPGASGTAGSEGNFYFDDIKIRPALNSRFDSVNNRGWYTTQSCRLYPKSDSLACDYYEDSGNRLKGWYGYCLQYDRAPGNPNACLLWYPIDKAKGDGLEEGAGYQGKAPVYYCTEAKALIPVEYRKARYIKTVSSGWTDGWCQDAKCNAASPSYTSSGRVIGNDCYCAPNGGECLFECNFIKGSSAPGWKPDGWYKYDGSFQEAEAEKGIKFYDPLTNKIYDDTFAYCTKIVQTVNSIGDNKFWASRVYKGSDWKVWFNPETTPPAAYGYYQYGTDGAPFGSVMAPSSNPYDWDGSTADGIQPLLVKPASSGGVRATNPYKFDDSKIEVGVCLNSGNICLNIKDSAGKSLAYDLNKAGCPAGQGACQSVNFSGRPESPIDKLKLLFAKSYGAWKWGGDGSYTCSAGAKNGEECLGKLNDCPGGTCETDSIGTYCEGTDPLQSCDVASCPDNDCTVINFGYSTCGGEASGQKCCASGECKISSTPVKKCTGGVNNGNRCNDQYCAGGVCEYKSNNNLRYITDTDQAVNWGLPGTNGEANGGRCWKGDPGDYTTNRSEANNYYCAIVPEIKNVKINGSGANVTLTKNGFVNLTFNTKVDSNQLPLVMYAVDWGDGESTTVTGVEMRDRPDPLPTTDTNYGNPHSMYHLYSYWDLKAKANQGKLSNGSCGADYCQVKPSVQIKDNWGWYNKGTAINIAPSQWDSFDGYVVVKEK